MIGVGYQHPKYVERKLSDFSINPNKRGELQIVAQNSSNHAHTQKEILDFWGAPEKNVLDKNGFEVWTYKDKKLIWQGPVLGLGFPLPLTVIPSGHYKTILTFKDSILVNAGEKTSGACFFGYGIGDKDSGFLCGCN